MVQEQEKAPAGGEHPGDLPDARLDRVDVLDHEAHHDRVERPRSARQVVGDGPGVERAARPLLGHRDLRPGRIEPDHVGAEADRPTRDLPLPTPDVEHPPDTCEVPIDERKDLLLVLRVGTIGELALPPLRVLLPERRIVHVHRAILTHAATVPALEPKKAPVEVTSSLRGRPLAEKAASGGVRLASPSRSSATPTVAR